MDDNNIIIPVSSLKGEIQYFTVSSTITLEDFKREVYNLHRDITRPFPVDQIDKLDIQLTLQGTTLNSGFNLAGASYSNVNPIYISVKSKPVAIESGDSGPVMNFNQSFLGEYTTSPAQISGSPNWLHGQKLEDEMPDDKFQLISKSLLRISSEIRNLSEQISKLSIETYGSNLRS
jgi:hypothetical protein